MSDAKLNVTLYTKMEVSQVKTAVNDMQKSLNKLSLPEKLNTGPQNLLASLESEIENYEKMSAKGLSSQKDYTALENSAQKIKDLYAEIQEEARGISILGAGNSDKLMGAFSDENKKKIEVMTGALQKYKAKQEEITKVEEKLEIAKAKQQSLSAEGGMDKYLKSAEASVVKLNAELNSLKTSPVFTEIENELKKIGIPSSAMTSVENMEAVMTELKNQGFTELATRMENFTKSIKEASGAFDELGGAANRGEKELGKLIDRSKDFDHLKSRITYFFGLANVVQLVRRTIQKAISAIKEFDEAMTKTAVVTSMDVGDMWEKMPQYTKYASELGIKTVDLYKASTLYYQQGLRTNEVMALSVETMKMARIAGVEAADATDYMTNALRGFNLEINETNAQRVNDVYSQLAAMSAASTKEIATAMTKVASIASSSGMSLENTSAMLTTIVEATRESAQTSGTALKTVIARFGEVKELFSKGQLTGEDIEGEAININKIDAALKSVGMSLNKFLLGEEGLDAVLLELASKWDTLDVATQRYIATNAAGSRQQSRFLALMENYSRTTELISAATDSAGAANNQFEKTLDSLESKIARLTNAWNNFILGIADSSLIKIAVDALTGLLNVLNKITDWLPRGLSGFAKLGLAIGGFKIAESLLTGVFASIKTRFANLGKDSATGFQRGLGSGLKETGNKIKAIFSKTYWNQIGKITIPVDVAGLDKVTKAYQRQQKAVKDLSNATRLADQYRKEMQNAPNAAAQMSSRGRLGAQTKKVNAAEAEASAANIAYANSFANVNTALNLSEGEQMAFNAALGMNMSAEEALIMTKYNSAEVIRLAAAATAEGTVVTEKDAAACLAAAIAEKKKAEAKALSTLGLFKNIVAMIFATGQRKKELAVTILQVAAEGKSVIAKKLATLWTKLLGKSVGSEAAAKDVASASTTKLTVVSLGWLAIILLIIAAVVLLVVGIVALAKAMKAASYDGQLSALEDELRRVKEAASDANEELNNMLTSRSEYDDLQDTLKGLVEGTEEWTEALKENNSKVLELISTYPELARLGPIASNGVLKISEAQWEALEYQQRLSIALMNLNAAGLNVQTAEIKKNHASIELFKYLKKPEEQDRPASTPQQARRRENVPVSRVSATPEQQRSRGVTRGLYSAEEKDKLTDFAAALTTQGLSFENDEAAIKKLYKEIFNVGLTDDYYNQLKNSSDALAELGKGVDSLNLQLSVFSQTLLQSAALLSETSGSSFSPAIIKAMGTTLSGTQAGQKLKAEAEKVKNNTSRGDAKQQYADMFGYGYSNGKIYSTKTRSEQNKDTRIKVDMDSIYEAIAEQNLIKQYSSQMTKMANEFDRVRALGSLESTDEERIKRVLQGEATSLTQADIEAIEAVGGDVKKYLESFGMSLEGLAIDFGYYDDLLQKTKGNRGEVQAEIEKKYNGEQGLTSLGSMTYPQLQRYSTALADLAEKWDTDAAEAVVGLVEDSGKLLEDESIRELFYSQIGNITDFTDAGQIDQLVFSLSNLGDVSDADQLIIDGFVTALKETAVAVQKIDLESLIEKFKMAASALDKATKGDTKYTDEEFELFQSNGVDVSQFAKTFEGYTYLGDTADLANDINQTFSTEAQAIKTNYENSVAQLEQARNAAKEAEVAAEEAKAEEHDRSARTPQQARSRVNVPIPRGSTPPGQSRSRGINAGGDDSAEAQRESDEAYQAFIKSISSFGEYRDVDELTAEMEAYKNELAELNAKDVRTPDEDTRVKQLNEIIGQYGLAIGLASVRTEELGEAAKESAEELRSAFGLIADKLLKGEQGRTFSETDYKRIIEKYPDLIDSFTLLLDGTYLYTGANLDYLAKAALGAANSLGRVEELPSEPGSAPQDVTSDVAAAYDQLELARAARDAVEADDSLTPKEKRAELKEYSREIEALEEKYNLAVENLQAAQNRAGAYISSGDIYGAATDQSIEVQKTALIGLGVAYEVDEELIQAYISALENGTEGSILAAKNALVQETAYKKQYKALKNLQSVTEKQMEILTDPNIDKTSKYYQDALGDVAAAASEVFGTDVSKEWVENNLDWLEEFVEGGEEYASDIAEAMALATAKSAIGGQELLKILGQINSKDLEIGGTADFSQIFGQLAALLGSAKAAEDFLESMGYTVDWVFVGNKDGDPKLPIYKTMVTKTGRPPSGRGGGGGSSGGKWENPYDKYYNVTQRSEGVLRDRNRLESEYDRLLKSRLKTYNDIYKNQVAQLDLLRQEIRYQKTLEAGNLEQLQNVGSELYTDDKGKSASYSDLGVTRYAQYNETLGTVEIDYDAIAKITDETLGSQVESYISRLEELQDLVEEARDALLEARDGIEELQQLGKEEFLDFEGKILGAIVAREKRVIDELSTLNSELTDSNSKILSAIQDSISLSRQIRDNTKTEEDIADKEARLAYLRRDTSGANATEILSLQKELDDARESYEDTIVDQKLEELQDQNDKAAEQREKQISLLESQLDLAQKTGAFNEEIQMYIEQIASGTVSQGLVDLLTEAEAFGGMTEIGKVQWWRDLTESVKAAQQGYGNWLLDLAEESGETVSATDTSGGNGVSGTIVKNDTTGEYELVASDGTVYGGLAYNENGNLTYSVLPNEEGPAAEDSEEDTEKTNTKKTTDPSYMTDEQKKSYRDFASGTVRNAEKNKSVNSSELSEIKTKANDLIKYLNKAKTIKSKADDYKSELSEAYSIAIGVGGGGVNKMEAFATGGLNTKTGIAWLDGTPSQPELVLNAKDTQNFLQLTNVLRGLRLGDGLSGGSGGTVYLDIQINVDELASDYDVEKLTEKVKQQIYNEASYRNINFISRLI